MRNLRIICLTLFSTAILYAATYNKAVETAKSQTVLISKEGFLGGSRGSGVLLDPMHVLTCAHMIEDSDDELLIYTYPMGTVIKAHPMASDVADDLAILVLDSSAPFKSKPVFSEAHYDGEHIYVVGNALGSMHWYVTSGVISGEERNYLLTDASVQHGNSGGPWINDKGEIVALTDWKLKDRHGDGEVVGVCGGVSAQAINRFFRAIEAQKKKKMQAALEWMFGG